MSRTLICLFLAAVLPASAVEPASSFPRPNWFRQHFGGPRNHVELQAPRRLSDYVAGGKLELSMRAYIELTLENNTDIAISRLQVESPLNGIQRTLAEFDPVLTTSFSSTRSSQASINALEGTPTGKTLTQPLSFSYQQRLSTGTSVNVGLWGTRSSNNYAYSTYNPVLSSNLQISVEQPLLQNRNGSISKMNLLLARSNLRISRYQLRDDVTAIIAAAESIYWDAIAARDNLALAEKLKELRAAALERAQKQVDAGALLPLDIFQPKSDYASAQLMVTRAKSALAQRENALRQQIGADLDPAIRDLPITLTEPVTIAVAPPPDKEEAVRKALQTRPDRQAMLATLEADDIGISKSAELLRPNVALTGSYTTSGVGGTYLETGAPGGLGDAMRQMFGFGFPAYSFGIRVRLPVRDRAGAADLAEARLRKQRDALTLRKMDQTLRRQVLDAVENLQSAQAGLEQATLARDFAERRFAAEQKKYELQLTELYFVLNAQSGLNAAEAEVLQQHINYRRNLLALMQLTGELLDDRGIILE
jgi:outer membrane protein TolC